MGFVVGLAALATIVINFFFAFGIKDDGERLRSGLQGPLFVPSAIWGLATLLGGLPVVALYWLIHHSSLNTLPPRQ